MIPLIIPALGGLAAGVAYFQARQDEPQYGGAGAFGTDPKYRTREAATANYIEYVRGMGWPEDISEVLEMEATFAPADDAEEVYLHMLREGPVVLEDMQYSPGELRNWDKAQIWLREAAEASGATLQALQEASPLSVAGAATTASAQDLRSGLETAGDVTRNLALAAKTGTEAAARNPWPFVIGIAMTGIILRRAKII